MDCTPTRTVAWADTEIAPVAQPHNSSLDVSRSTSIIFTSIPRLRWRRTSGTGENVACYTLKHHAAAENLREVLYMLKNMLHSGCLWRRCRHLFKLGHSQVWPGLQPDLGATS